MEPNTNDQQFVPPTPVTHIPKNSFNWKKVLYIVVITVLIAALLGFAVWAYMSKQDDSKSLNAQITTKNKTITSLQSNVKNLETQVASKTSTNTNTSQQSTSGTGMFESFVAFCETNNKSVSVATLTNTSGSGEIGKYFGNCAVTQAGALTGGYQATARYVNNAWEDIYDGQGPAQSSVCTKYNIPSVLQVCS